MIALVLGGVAACGGGSKGGGGGDAAPAGTDTLVVSPDTATVMLAPKTPNGIDFTGTQNFTVTLKAADGTTTDVTAMAQLLNDDAHLSLSAGALTVDAAGQYTVSFTYGAGIANAQVTAVLNGKNVDGSLPSGSDGMLDGTPDANTHPTIEYPLNGSLFPVNIAPVEIHVQKSNAAQTIARVELTSGTTLEYLYYAPCQASPQPAVFKDTCIVALTGAFGQQLAGVSETADVQIKIRLAGPAGQNLVESAPITAAWSKVALTGGLYYWTTAPANSAPGAATTEFARYNFDGDASKPKQYLLDTSAPTVASGTPQCVGCHALSPDGSKLSFSMGGSTASFFALLDVVNPMPPTASRTTGSAFAGMSTFSKDGSRVVTMDYGVLTLRNADTTLSVIQDNLLSGDVHGEKLSHPFWAPSGQHFAFVSWIPSAADLSGSPTHNTGDMVQGGQIWVAKSDGKTITPSPTLIVPRVDGTTSYYPAISDDDQLVVFNQSSCSGPANTAGGGAWGVGPCDGYQDPSATLHLVPLTGGTPIALDNANGGVPNVTNSWPRWSPDHGEFRGKRLYWVAFSSRRAYGRALPSPYTTTPAKAADATKPQLWFAAIAVPDDGTQPTTDPSFAPVWLPGQNTQLDQNGQVDPSSSQANPRGNHTPVWTSKVVGGGVVQ